MNFKKYNALYNVLWFQTTWFVAVLGGDNWFSFLLILLMLHVWLVEDKKTELLFILSGASFGIAVDFFLTYKGFYLFNPERAFFIFPLWMMVIWLGFCGTLRHSMKPLTSKPVLMVIASFCFAPLSYLAASRLGAVEFPEGEIITLLITGFSWMFISTFLLFFNRLFSPVKDSPDILDAAVLKQNKVTQR